MNVLISMFLGLLVFLPGYSMEEKSVLQEKLILIVETSDNNSRSIIPKTIIKHMEEHLAVQCGGNKVPINTYFDLTFTTPEEARKHFSNSPLYIVTLGVGEAPINYSDMGKITQSPTAKYDQEMRKLTSQMADENLILTHKRIQVIMDSSTLKSNNEAAFKNAAHSVANSSNPSQDGYPLFMEIINKLVGEHKKKSAK